MEQWKKVVLHHVDSQVRLCHLPAEDMAPGSARGRRQAGGGSVMLWTMFWWETLSPDIHVDVPIPPIQTFLQNKYIPSW